MQIKRMKKIVPRFRILLLVLQPIFFTQSRISTPCWFWLSNYKRRLAFQPLLLLRMSNMAIGEIMLLSIIKFEGIANLYIGKWRISCRALIRNIMYFIEFSENDIRMLKIKAIRNSQRRNSKEVLRALSNYLVFSLSYICFLIFDLRV